MRFMIIVKATADTEAGTLPTEAFVAPMASYHDELANAGVLLDANALQPTSRGWRIRYAGGKCSIIDGPFPHYRDLIARYTLIQVRSREEAMEWARRFPPPQGPHADGEIEVRQLFEWDHSTPCGSAENPHAMASLRA